jgi:hypothetical protein
MEPVFWQVGIHILIIRFGGFYYVDISYNSFNIICGIPFLINQFDFLNQKHIFVGFYSKLKMKFFFVNNLIFSLVYAVTT